MCKVCPFLLMSDISMRSFIEEDTHVAQVTCNSWISCGFTSLSTLFQSYKDNGEVKMKGTV